MRRSFSTLAILGAAVAAVSGFSAPHSTTTQQQQQQQQHLSPRSTLFPVPHKAATLRCPNNKFQKNDIIATRMTNDEEATTSKEGAVEATPASSTTETNAAAAESKSNNSKGAGFSLILLPTLIFKFTIVLIVKFATDVVVFPLLWSYRLARLGKRKVLRGVRKLFGKEDGVDKVNGVNGVKVNGDSPSV